MVLPSPLSMLYPVASLSAKHPRAADSPRFCKTFFYCQRPPIADVGDIILTLTRDQTPKVRDSLVGPARGWTPTPLCRTSLATFWRANDGGSRGDGVFI